MGFRAKGVGSWVGGFNFCLGYRAGSFEIDSGHGDWQVYVGG